jgi:hypothetical protein
MTVGSGTAEQQRLAEARERGVPWRKWGPYLSERQWGTVREDYSDNGDAWNSFTHDQARSRAYHWARMAWPASPATSSACASRWPCGTGRTHPEGALFGLTNAEGNHGEDVKEYYFYLDSTPTHSYMKWLYKYPQAAYPYDELVRTNRHRSRTELEYELLDTRVFEADHYFDVSVEYAKHGPEDILIRIAVANRRAEAATLHVLPTLWFRNTWTWWPDRGRPILARSPNTPFTVKVRREGHVVELEGRLP